MQPDPQFRAETARGAEVRTAERVSKIQRVVSICEVHDTNSHRGFGSASSVQRLGDCQVDNCVRADVTTVEIHELGAWTLHQLNEIILFDLERRAALVTCSNRC